MIRAPRENEIVFFRYRNRAMGGICQSVTGAKARFATQDRAVNVPVDNVLLATGQIASDGRSGQAWIDRAEAESESIDLKELWELVREEPDDWDLRSLGEMLFGADPESLQLASLLLGLEAQPYFEDGGGSSYRAQDEESVRGFFEAQEREAAREVERQRFLTWFKERDGEADEEWIERLKDIALFGDTSTHKKWLDRLTDGEIRDRAVFDRLVAEAVWSKDEHLGLRRHEVGVEFSELIEHEASNVDLEPLFDNPKRRDLTGLEVMTVDDPHTTDIDDALSLEILSSDTVRLGVHITDVGPLVPAGSAVDREASTRISSLYFPDRKISMLPDRVSADLGSLVPNERRLAISVLTDFTGGVPGEVEVVPSIVRSRRRWSYEEIDRELESPSPDAGILGLHELAESLWNDRLLNGAVPVEQPDRSIRVLQDGTIEFSVRSAHSAGVFLVSEMMVFANQAIARLCRDADVPIVYRTQQAPDLSVMDDVPNESVRRYRLLRQMKRAEMSEEPGPHGGLGIEPYTQATSPLRRYADLVVQRQVAAHLMSEALPYGLHEIRGVIFEADERLRQLRGVERRRERHWLIRYLEPRVGNLFGGLVLERRQRDMMVDIPELAMLATVRPADTVEEGEEIRLKLGRCDVWAGNFTFLHITP